MIEHFSRQFADAAVITEKIIESWIRGHQSHSTPEQLEDFSKYANEHLGQRMFYFILHDDNDKRLAVRRVIEDEIEALNEQYEFIGFSEDAVSPKMPRLKLKEQTNEISN